MEPNSTRSADQPGRSERLTYSFGEFELDLSAWKVCRNGRPKTLHRKPTQVLAYLLEHPERTVSREEILAALWPATRVAPGSLTQAIWEIRRLLSEQPNGARMITTVRGGGYRFEAQVTRRSGARSADLAIELSGGNDSVWPEPLRERLRMLSWETRAIVLELAMLLAQRADTVSEQGSPDPRHPRDEVG